MMIMIFTMTMISLIITGGAIHHLHKHSFMNKRKEKEDMEKRQLNRDDLLFLSDCIEDEDTKKILKRTYDVLDRYKHFKYISKNVKRELIDIGFRFVDKYVTHIYEMDYNIKSKEIDILTDQSGVCVLRVGLGRKRRYSPEWYEIEVKL